MKRNRVSVMLSGLVVALVAAAVVSTMTLAAGGPPTGTDSGGRGRGAQGAGMAAGGMGAGYVATGTLDENEVAALNEFLLDEHKALATYASIMAQFGEIEPFASIATAEERHIAALERVYTRYGVALPAIPDFDAPAFASVEAAAAAAVQAEIDNAALYDALLGEIDNADVIRVAENLRDASLNNHLPAFQAVVDGTFVAGECDGEGAPQGPRGPQGMGGGATTPGARGAGMRGQGSQGQGTGDCLTDTVKE